MTLHVQDEMTPAAVKPVPSDLFATVCVRKLRKSTVFTRDPRTSELLGVENIPSPLHNLSDQHHAPGKQDAKTNDNPIARTL